SADLSSISSGGITGQPSALPPGFKLINGYLVGPTANLSGANLSGIDLSGIDLSSANFSGANLSGANLSRSKLFAARLENVNLSISRLDSANLVGAKGHKADLSGSNLSGAVLNNSQLQLADLSYCNLTDADLSGTYLVSADLGHSKLVRATLINADLGGANLVSSDLSGADLSDADLQVAKLSNAKLSQAIISQANLLRVDFTNAILNGAILNDANLSRADLTRADLSEANLTRASLSEANLTDTDFFRADLSSSNLSDTNISGANLSEAKMLNADFQKSKITNVNFFASDLSNTNFSRADFSKVSSGGIIGVPSAFPVSFHLINGYLVGPDVDLSGADFSNVDLSGVDLTGSNLTGADLSGADLTDANLSLTNLSNARAFNTIIAGSDFTSANLSGVVTNDKDFFRQIDQYNFPRGNISLTRRTSTFSIETLSLSRQPVSITEYDKEFDTRPDWSWTEELEEWELEEFGINPNDDPRELAVARATVTERSIHFGVNLSKTSLSRGSSSGNLSFNFRVNQETSYNVAGFTKFLESAGSSSMNASLSGDSIEAIFSVSHQSEGSPVVSLDDEVREGRGNHLQGKLSGILQPGEYQLNVGIVHNGGWESVGSGEFTMTFGSSKDGKVVSWGQGGDFSSVASELDRGVKTVAATRNAFAALKNNGSVVTWGNDSNGGDSSEVISKLLGGVDAIYANNEAFAALKEDGSVVTWGNAECGGNSSVYRATGPSWDIHSVHEEISVASKLSSGVVQIFANHCAFAALKEDGSVVTWGNGLRGGDSSSVESELTDIVEIYPSEICFAAVKQDGSVITWGDPASGGDSSSVRSDL
ncbi:MAG: pentapeptide repeat-containing protein, partial [Akkermansiaceae bacterium]|nr:pentapeptide repeat-containing protein [Akkermansiaceae bacterium]